MFVKIDLKMKIAFIVPALVNKGPVIVVKELISQFVKNGHTCKVFYFDEKVELSFDCPVFIIRKNDEINFAQFDVVHSHGLRPDKYVFKNKQKKTDTLYVTTLHNYVFQDLKYQYNWFISFLFGNLWMYLLKRHDIVITLSIDALNYYKKILPKSKLDYAYNTRVVDVGKSISDDDRNLIYNFKGNSILIGVNALLTHRKGVDLLIQAMPFLPEFKLFVIGEGKSRKELEQLASKLGVQERCFFAGYKSDAYRYLKYYDIYALPSRSEGFPLSLLEASIYGLPTVTSNLPVILETFSSEEISFFDIAKPESIIEALKKAGHSKDLGLKLKNKYYKSYSPELMYEKYLAIYKDGIKNNL